MLAMITRISLCAASDTEVNAVTQFEFSVEHRVAYSMSPSRAVEFAVQFSALSNRSFARRWGWTAASGWSQGASESDRGSRAARRKCNVRCA